MFTVIMIWYDVANKVNGKKSRFNSGKSLIHHEMKWFRNNHCYYYKMEKCEWMKKREEITGNDWLMDGEIYHWKIMMMTMMMMSDSNENEMIP